jgi:hypothetical protein
MATLSGLTAGKQTRALMAALALGASVLSFSPGPAHAEQANPNTPPNDLPKCTRTRADGHVDFYLPGDAVSSSDNQEVVRCGRDGQWHKIRRAPGASGGARVPRPTSGGVYAP